MLAIVNTPGGAAPVELREIAEPQPAANEALVEVRAFSLNRGELRLFQVRPEGWRPGQDISGVVVKQAADGSGPAAGTRVVALTDNAGWAERAAVPSHRMAALPDNARFEAAAALPVAGLTALRTLRHGAPLLGKRVLITGAAGGVGHMAVQIAARSGARVAAVVGGPERGRHLRGAAEIVKGVDRAQGRFALILESAGGASLSAAIARVEARGTIVIFGNSSGEPTPLSFRDFAEHPNARIQSFSYFTSEHEDRFAPDLALLAALVGDGSLKPVLSEHSWRDIAKIGPELRDRRIAGKAVFHIDQALKGATSMTIKVGDKLPSVTLRYVTPDGVKAVTTEEFFGGKKVVLFGLPGAYTRTCSERHLPGYVMRAAELKAKGVDTIACLAANDHFVMNAWGKERGADDKIIMLGDGSSDFTRAIGLELDRTKEGMGMRSQRYSMLVENGVVKALNVEQPGQFDVSSAEAMMKEL